MSPNARPIRFLFVLFGLLPCAGWLALYALLDPGGIGRSIGLAILVILAPLPVGGLLMIASALLMGARPQAGRIVATVGAGIVAMGAFALAGAWVYRFSDCGGALGLCIPEFYESLAGFAYALIHGSLIYMVWQSRKTAAPVTAGHS